MIKYYFYLIKNKIAPKKARILFNTSSISRRKKNKILSKAGLMVSHQTAIVEPFYFEFGNVEISGDVLINTGCAFLDNEMITIKTGSMIGPNVTLTTVSHHTDPDLRHGENILAPIDIGENVWIGAGAVVLPGVTIGDNSVIAANSVVKSDIPSNELCPAVFKRSIKL